VLEIKHISSCIPGMSVSSQGTGISDSHLVTASADKSGLLKVVQDKQQQDHFRAETGQARRGEPTSSATPSVPSQATSGFSSIPKKKKNKNRRRRNTNNGASSTKPPDEGSLLLTAGQQWEQLKQQVKHKADDISGTVKPLREKLEEYKELARETGQGYREAAQQKLGTALETAEERLGGTKAYIHQQAANLTDAAQQVRETMSEKAIDLREEMGETLEEIEEDIGETIHSATSTVMNSTGETVRCAANQAKESVERLQTTVSGKVEDVRERYESLLEEYNEFKTEAASGRGPSLLDKAFTAISDFSSWLTGAQADDEDEYQGYEEDVDEGGEPDELIDDVEVIELDKGQHSQINSSKPAVEDDDDSFIPEIKRASS